MGLIFHRTFECACKISSVFLQNHYQSLVMKLRNCISIYFGCMQWISYQSLVKNKSSQNQ